MSFTITNESKKKVISCECYSRISGYYRPVQQYNAGKREEFYERKYLNINDFKDS